MSQNRIEPKDGFYFVPDQLMVQVSHEAGRGSGELAAAITSGFVHLRSIAIERNQALQEFLSERIEAKEEQIVTTTTERSGTRSLAWVSVTNRGMPSVQDSDFIVETVNQQMAQFVDTINDYLRAEPFQHDGVTFSSVTPNWFSTGAPGGRTGTGGPGAKPVPPATINLSRPPYKFHVNQSSALRELIENPPNTSTASSIEVVILDTAPPPQNCEDVQGRFSNNELFNRLCRTGKLTIHRYDTEIESNASIMKDLNDDSFGVEIKGHEYNMSDHGLFIAGIVNTIAPYAKIRLIEVLNQYGVGTLWTIAKGIEHAITTREDSNVPLIVNCSFTINLPLPTKEVSGKRYYGHLSPGLNWANADQSQGAIEQAFDPLMLPDILVVAAAGNDGKADTNRPQARLPAQLPGITGVAALKKNLTVPAEYSNIADKPECDGVAVFGGNLGQGDHADPDSGILGVYTGSFPDGTPNTDGWARWAGTSFATPIIAGVLALLRGDGRSASEAVQAIGEAEIEQPPDQSQTQLLLVDQF